MDRLQFQTRNIERARDLRRTSSPAERMLWKSLSRRQIQGHHFTRQRQIGPYFADFACRQLKLVIELDGYSHDMRQMTDQTRDAFLKGQGWTVLRFRNGHVMENLDAVLTAIAAQIAALPSPGPSRLREGSQ